MNTVKIAIIQLTRIGDVLQTLKAVRQLKSEHTNLHLTLIARKKFAGGLVFLLETIFDEIVLIETKELVVNNLSDSLNKQKILLNELRAKKFALAVNLSFNKSSGYLTTLINSQLTTGITRDTFNKIVINDKWSQYLFATTMKGTTNPFNLVDVFKYILGCKQSFPLEDFNHHLPKSYITIHPFASDRKKHWGANKWADIIHRLLKENPDHEVHIVGSKDDLTSAKSIAMNPVLAGVKEKVHLTINKDLIHVYELLTKSALFIGHDSMVSHMASETLTPSLIVSLGTVRPHETIPYQENVIALAPKTSCFPCTVQTSCDLLPCHGHIPHQAASTIGSLLLNKEDVTEEKLSKQLTPFQMNSMTVYKNTLFTENMETNQLSRDNDNVKESFRIFYKVLWHLYLNDLDIKVTPPRLSKDSLKVMAHYLDGVNYLYELYSFSVKYSNSILQELSNQKPNEELINKDIEKMNEIDHLCNITMTNYPLLADLINTLYVRKVNTSGNNLKEIIQEQLIIFCDGIHLTQALYSLIEKTVGPSIIKKEIREV